MTHFFKIVGLPTQKSISRDQYWGLLESEVLAVLCLNPLRVNGNEFSSLISTFTRCYEPLAGYESNAAWLMEKIEILQGLIDPEAPDVGLIKQAQSEILEDLKLNAKLTREVEEELAAEASRVDGSCDEPRVKRARTDLPHAVRAFISVIDKQLVLQDGSPNRAKIDTLINALSGPGVASDEWTLTLQLVEWHSRFADQHPIEYYYNFGFQLASEITKNLGAVEWYQDVNSMLILCSALVLHQVPERQNFSPDDLNHLLMFYCGVISFYASLPLIDQSVDVAALQRLEEMFLNCLQRLYAMINNPVIKDDLARTIPELRTQVVCQVTRLANLVCRVRPPFGEHGEWLSTCSQFVALLMTPEQALLIVQRPFEEICFSSWLGVSIFNACWLSIGKVDSANLGLTYYSTFLERQWDSLDVSHRLNCDQVVRDALRFIRFPDERGPEKIDLILTPLVGLFKAEAEAEVTNEVRRAIVYGIAYAFARFLNRAQLNTLLSFRNFVNHNTPFLAGFGNQLIRHLKILTSVQVEPDPGAQAKLISYPAGPTVQPTRDSIGFTKTMITQQLAEIRCELMGVLATPVQELKKVYAVLDIYTDFFTQKLELVRKRCVEIFGKHFFIIEGIDETVLDIFNSVMLTLEIHLDFAPPQDDFVEAMEIPDMGESTDENHHRIWASLDNCISRECGASIKSLVKFSAWTMRIEGVIKNSSDISSSEFFDLSRAAMSEIIEKYGEVKGSFDCPIVCVLVKACLTAASDLELVENKGSSGTPYLYSFALATVQAMNDCLEKPDPCPDLLVQVLAEISAHCSNIHEFDVPDPDFSLGDVRISLMSFLHQLTTRFPDFEHYRILVGQFNDICDAFLTAVPNESAMLQLACDCSTWVDYELLTLAESRAATSKGLFSKRLAIQFIASRFKKIDDQIQCSSKPTVQRLIELLSLDPIPDSDRSTIVECARTLASSPDYLNPTSLEYSTIIAALLLWTLPYIDLDAAKILYDIVTLKQQPPGLPAVIQNCNSDEDRSVCDALVQNLDQLLRRAFPDLDGPAPKFASKYNSLPILVAPPAAPAVTPNRLSINLSESDAWTNLDKFQIPADTNRRLNLKNFGNECYADSVFLMLANPVLMRLLFEQTLEEIQAEIRVGHFNASAAEQEQLIRNGRLNFALLLRFLSTLITGDFAYIRPAVQGADDINSSSPIGDRIQLLQVVKRHLKQAAGKRFASGRQECALEFYLALLACCNMNLGIQIGSQIGAVYPDGRVKYGETKIESASAISFPIGAATVAAGIRHFSEPEKLEGYTFDSKFLSAAPEYEGAPEGAQKELRILGSKEVLVFSDRRHTYRGAGKSGSEIAQSHSKLMPEPKIEIADQSFELAAVVMHSGTAFVGHYITAVRVADGTWVLGDDLAPAQEDHRLCIPKSLPDVMVGTWTPYIMVYQAQRITV